MNSYERLEIDPHEDRITQRNWADFVQACRHPSQLPEQWRRANQQTRDYMAGSDLEHLPREDLVRIICWTRKAVRQMLYCFIFMFVLLMLNLGYTMFGKGGGSADCPDRRN